MTAQLIKSLREKRQELITNSRKILDKAEAENRDLNADENRQWTEANADITNLGKRVERLQQQADLESAQNNLDDHGLGGAGSHVDPDKKTLGTDSPDMTPDQAWNEIFNSWARAERDGYRPTNRVKQAARQLGVSPKNRRILTPLDRDYRNLRSRLLRNANMTTSGGSGANGGYTIPTGFVPALETAMLWFGPMLQVADVMRTESGNPLQWPTANDTGNTGALLDEETTVGSSVIATFARTTFNAYKFSSKLVLISTELLEDSQFDLATLLGSMLGERLGRVANTYATVGTGTSQPQGIVAGSTLGKTAADDATLTFDEVIDLEHSVGLAYRRRAAYMCSDATVLALRKLKNGQGNYLWQQNTNSGQPDLLNNRPLWINEDMADMAASAKALLCGDFSYFKVRMVAGVRSRRLSERYADTDQEGFVSFLRMDSKVLDAGTNPIKHLAMAAS